MVIGKVEVPPEQSAAVPVTTRVSLHPERPRTETGSAWESLQVQGEEGVGVAGPGAPGWASRGYLNEPLDSGRRHQESVRGPTPSHRPLTPESPQHAGNRAMRGSEGT